MLKNYKPKVATNISQLYLGLSFHILFSQNEIIFTRKFYLSIFSLFPDTTQFVLLSYYILWC